MDVDAMDVTALDPDDPRVRSFKVVGPAALLVAKLHKLGERINAPQRLNDKDAHDAYRNLRTTQTAELGMAFARLLEDPLSASATREALRYAEELFAAGPEAIGAMMAGRAELGVGSPEEVSVATAILASDLVVSLRRDGLY
ncbi:hypothetical protein [Flexivirga caeni]|uniref:hypothetical protein n=1 Tax=Flexivirga caeni TaxID=2294115 RepID=UPI001C656D90|nr:hypothetical protein [Flexivirga caeni]